MNNNNLAKKQIGLIGACAIVTGNMMGSGIALLPANMAAIGSITLISWLITFLGALALAYVFARLGIINPKVGGPVAYANHLSPILGFQTGILYWVANWIGNLAIAITGVSYLSVFYSPLINPIIGGITTIALIWFFTIINFFGAGKIAKMVSVTVILLLIPVIGTALFGWGHFSKEQFLSNWNVSNTSAAHAIFLGILLAIWSFIGVESVSVSAGLVKRPKRTIPIATMIGTSIAALAYIASTTAISGMFSASKMKISGAPFAVSFGAIVGSWVKPYVSLFTAIACLASLGSWMMIVGQAGVAASKQNTLPKIFGITNKRNMPVMGLIINSSLMSGLMIILVVIGYFSKQSTIVVFKEVISIAVLLTILPYFYSCLQLIKLDGNRVIIFAFAILASLFCFTAFVGADNIELIFLVVVSFICFIFYAMKLNKQKVENL